MRSALSTTVAFGVSAALAAKSTLYHYMPVEFEYGADSRVTADITFGTAPSAEPVRVVMDSGSANFWIWSPNATVNWGSPYLGVEGPCNTKVPVSYDPALSPNSTVTNHTSGYAYAGNAKIVSGTQYANDTITSIGGSGPISNVQFALEDFGLFRIADNGSCVLPQYDQAILGLSYYNATKTDGPSFRQNLFENGQIASKTLFIWFDKHLGALGDLTGGILFGAIDTSKYIGPLVEVQNVVEEYEIGIYVAKPNITVGGQTFVPDGDVNCLVDSGAHADYLPFAFGSELEGLFYNATGGQIVDYNGVVAYNGSCESIPQDFNITYTFAGVSGKTVDVSVPLRNYARGLYDPYNPYDTCLLNLEIGGCTFGAPFQSAAAVLLDDEGDRVAFAQAAVSKEGDGVNEDSLVVMGLEQSVGFWESLK
ncbi:aspartic peptidase domain-containing protein [Cadophora sp. MPI-SDFR-AT-0126]|nr:aspartic peptidase domain-containing protein [Leotiomycetes sp. MPI-SDFR-AT-0126]